MTCNPSPFPLAVLAEATRISPHRRISSDGICGDAAHAGRVSDHNPDARGIPHAVDISQSTPGAPFWLPTYGLFDAHAYGWQIANRMRNGSETRVKYLVSFDGTRDVIFDPAVSLTWRENGTGTEHASHLHVSFLYEVAVEQSTAPFFQPAVPPPAPKVKPDMHVVPDSPIVSEYDCSRGCWLLCASGEILTMRGGFYGTPFGKPYWSGRVAAQLRPNPNLLARFSHPYVVIDTAGEIYGRNGF